MAKTRATVTVRDHGAEKRIAEFLKAKSRITVGIHADAGGETYAEGATVADIATTHEFGLGVPRRSWLADWFDQKRQEIEQAIKSSALSFAKGTKTLAQALDTLGSWAKGSIQARISARIAPPLAPSTIAKKKSSVPLIDTGHFRSSIDYKVKDR